VDARLPIDAVVTLSSVRGLRVLLIEDDAPLARGIAAALSQTGYKVDTAPDAASALRLANAAAYAIGVLDLGLPDRDGIDLLRQLRGAGYAFPILILSARDGLDERVRGLDAGSDDYLVKPFALSELEARLRALLRRMDEHVPWRQIGRVRCDLDGHRAFVDEAELDLTRREFAVLATLVRRAGKVVGKEALFDAVFPSDSEVAANALEIHISRLRQKLRHAGVSIRALRGIGYRIEEIGANADAAG